MIDKQSQPGPKFFEALSLLEDSLTLASEQKFDDEGCAFMCVQLGQTTTAVSRAFCEVYI